MLRVILLSCGLCLVFSSGVFAQFLQEEEFPNFAVAGSIEYPFLGDFDTKIYGLILEFNILDFRKVNILNTIEYLHRLSGTKNYFPTHLLSISHQIQILSEKILIENTIISSGTLIFSGGESIENRFSGGYNFLSSGVLGLYVGFIVFKGAEFSKELDGIPLPYVYFVYGTKELQVKLFPIEVSWKPNSLVHLKMYGFFDRSTISVLFRAGDSIHVGPEIDFNRDRYRISGLEKDEYVEVLYLETGLKYSMYYFSGFIGYSFFNEYSIKKRGNWVSSRKKMEPGHGFVFDLGFRVEF